MKFALHAVLVVDDNVGLIDNLGLENLFKYVLQRYDTQHFTVHFTLHNCQMIVTLNTEKICT